MFGDFGHGLLYLIFSFYLIYYKDHFKKNKSPLASIPLLFLFLMGFFATYCGSIYNEFFSIPLDLFGTCYEETISADESDSGEFEAV